jgi:hypothetical protein
MPYFHVAFNSTTPAINAPTLTPANWWQNDAVYRFILVHDFVGQFGVELTYPKALR